MDDVRMCKVMMVHCRPTRSGSLIYLLYQLGFDQGIKATLWYGIRGDYRQRSSLRQGSWWRGLGMLLPRCLLGAWSCVGQQGWHWEDNTDVKQTKTTTETRAHGTLTAFEEKLEFVSISYHLLLWQPGGPKGVLGNPRSSFVSCYNMK